MSKFFSYNQIFYEGLIIVVCFPYSFSVLFSVNFLCYIEKKYDIHLISSKNDLRNKWPLKAYKDQQIIMILKIKQLLIFNFNGLFFRLINLITCNWANHENDLSETLVLP